MIECPSCGEKEEELRYSWQVFSNGKKHIRVECKNCMRFIRYAPQVEPYVSLAGAVNGHS